MKQWMVVVAEEDLVKDNIKEWTGQSVLSLLRIANDSGRWTVIAAKASIGAPPTTLGRHWCWALSIGNSY